ncbi:MAG: DNA repair protein RecO [Pseudomonadota bacterium]
MRAELRPAYILHRQPYRETSLLLEAFSLDVGRVGLVARGARSGKGGKAGLLQPFVPLLLSWSGRGELATLTGAEGRGGLAPLTGTALISAFYLNELLLRLLQRHDPHEELFHAYELALQRLAAVPQQPEWTLRLFEKALLQELGYGLLLEHESHSDSAIQPERSYCYHVQQGPLPADAAAQAGPLLHGATLLALAAEQGADERVLAEAKTLMRTILAQYLGTRPLRSRELFRQTYAGRATPPAADHED